MTREEVVKWLESLKREIGKTENRTLWHYAESIDMAIEALSAEAVQGWIPVSERLPGKNGCYLVSTTGENNYIIDIAFYIEGMWHKTSRIKAWMPLPKPYEGGDSE